MLLSPSYDRFLLLAALTLDRHISVDDPDEHAPERSSRFTLAIDRLLRRSIAMEARCGSKTAKLAGLSSSWDSRAQSPLDTSPIPTVVSGLVRFSRLDESNQRVILV